MADLAERHPGARIVGVELDAENAALARLNVAPWGPRCEVIQAGVWPDDGELRYVRLDGATSGHHVTAAAPQGDPAVTISQSISPWSLLALEGKGARVDYAKIDVEGAEQELLSRNARLDRPRADGGRGGACALHGRVLRARPSEHWDSRRAGTRATRQP